MPTSFVRHALLSFLCTGLHQFVLMTALDSFKVSARCLWWMRRDFTRLRKKIAGVFLQSFSIFIPSRFDILSSFGICVRELLPLDRWILPRKEHYFQQNIEQMYKTHTFCLQIASISSFERPSTGSPMSSSLALRTCQQNYNEPAKNCEIANARSFTEFQREDIVLKNEKVMPLG